VEKTFLALCFCESSSFIRQVLDVHYSRQKQGVSAEKPHETEMKKMKRELSEKFEEDCDRRTFYGSCKSEDYMDLSGSIGMKMSVLNDSLEAIYDFTAKTHFTNESDSATIKNNVSTLLLAIRRYEEMEESSSESESLGIPVQSVPSVLPEVLSDHISFEVGKKQAMTRDRPISDSFGSQPIIHGATDGSLSLGDSSSVSVSVGMSRVGIASKNRSHKTQFEWFEVVKDSSLLRFLLLQFYAVLKNNAPDGLSIENIVLRSRFILASFVLPTIHSAHSSDKLLSAEDIVSRHEDVIGTRGYFHHLFISDNVLKIMEYPRLFSLICVIIAGYIG
ncbi:hypothetical protein ADUPG1_000910, partial [Aduncisulcus paluster]